MKKLTLLLLLPLIVGACGGGDSSSGGATSASVVLDDFSFTPPTVTLASGVEVTVNVSNVGGIQHSWVVLTQGEQVTSSSQMSDDRILAASADLNGGESDTVTFTLPGPGTYQVVCHIPGHIEANMVGTLEATG
jgi:uncharacterized cupredoxin-like copper-binding protein